MFFLFVSTILIIQLNGLGTTSAQTSPIFVTQFCLGDSYTANSTFEVNLNRLLSSLSSFNNNTIIKNGYYNDTSGRNSDTVYGSFQCRGDVTSELCKSCVLKAVEDISNICPNKKKSIIWYEECVLRYSDQAYFSILQEKPEFDLSNSNTVTNINLFNQILGDLFDRIVNEAASSSSSNKFASGVTNLTSFKQIFGLVLCTSDLSFSNCDRCLRGVIAQFPRCCGGKEGGRVIRVNCMVRYELYPFFQLKVTPEQPPSHGAPPPLSTTNTTTTHRTGKKTSKRVLYIGTPLVVGLVAIIAISCICLRRGKTKKKLEDVDEIRNAESLQFNFSIIRAATDDFSEAYKLGEGGFGSNYKGKLINGKEIAVKRLSRNSGQGEEEFKNEVTLLAKLQHKNLVTLLGFCLGREEKLLIYEFLPNASLDQFIFDPIKRTYIDWGRRYKIIGDIARGLLYLHEESRLKIIHRDLKASNILLDVDMNPKISDFGMARLFEGDQTQGNTNRIKGTYGYMPPEYARHGKFSVKSDVFSFGVLVLEILSGKKNSFFSESGGALDLLSYAWRQWNNGTALDILDPTLRDSCLTNEVMRCIHIGLLCVQEDISNRPIMSSVVLMLNSYSMSLALPSSPAYFMNTSVSSKESINEVSITELSAR